MRHLKTFDSLEIQTQAPIIYYFDSFKCYNTFGGISLLTEMIVYHQISAKYFIYSRMHPNIKNTRPSPAYPTPGYPTLLDALTANTLPQPPRYPILQKGHGTRDTLSPLKGTWDQRYPTLWKGPGTSDLEGN